MLDRRTDPLPERWGDDAISVREESRPDIHDSLEGSLTEAWRLLMRGVHDAQSPFHTPTLATSRLDGAANVRSVVLRGADPERRVLRFHADLRSNEYDELRRDDRLVLHFHAARRKIQLQVEGRAELHIDDTVADEAWASSALMSRICFGASKASGAVITDPATVSMDANGWAFGRKNFCAVEAHVWRLEWLYVVEASPRRACFEWAGDEPLAQWLAP